MRRIVWILAAAMVTVGPASASAQVREQNRNLVGGELLGRGLVITVNYERFLSNHLGFGAGVMAIGTKDGSAFMLPLYASYVSGDVHSFYLSAGTSYIGGVVDLNDYEDTWLLTASAGYQFHSYNGFFVRPLFTLFLPAESTDDFLIWPGITIGGSF